MAESDMHYNGEPVNTNEAADGGITTPVAPEGGAPAGQGNGWGTDMPTAPEGGMPVDSGNNNWGTTMPVAPEGGMPVDPGFSVNPDITVDPDFSVTPDYTVDPDFSVTPDYTVDPDFSVTPDYTVDPDFSVDPDYTVDPDFSVIPDFTVPSCPSCPIKPPSQYYGMVRFLNASTNSFPVNISIGGNNYAINSRFGTITNYNWVTDGFRTVTVRRASGLRTILYQNTFPFTAGEKVTMVLIDSGSGLDMVKVIDRGCTNMPYNSGCYRVANMSYSGSRYDVLLYGGEAVFRNVGFGRVTSYKQAMAGPYEFFVTNSNNFTVLREIPVIVIGAFTPSSVVNDPLVSYVVDIEAGKKYTTYMIGNTWSGFGFRVLMVED